MYASAALRKGRGDDRGFSLVELMIALTILSILTTIAVPVFLGMRDKAKVQQVASTAKRAILELQGWSQTATTGNRVDTETDTNCDGTIDGKDMNNGALVSHGIALAYVQCRNNGYNERSPWQPDISLWTFSTSTGPEGAPAGRITLIQESPTDRTITIIAKGIGNNTLYTETIRF